MVRCSMYGRPEAGSCQKTDPGIPGGETLPIIDEALFKVAPRNPQHY